MFVPGRKLRVIDVVTMLHGSVILLGSISNASKQFGLLLFGSLEHPSQIN
jgi:hypothetical protein